MHAENVSSVLGSTMGIENETVEKKGITIRLPDKVWIAMTLAVAGFLWNKVDGFLSEQVSMKIEESVFNHMQAQIDELNHQLFLINAKLVKETKVVIRKPVSIGLSAGSGSIEPVKTHANMKRGPRKAGRRVSYNDFVQRAVK